MRRQCLIFMLAGMLLATVPALAQDYTIRIGHIVSTEDEDHKGALVFKDYVEAQTNGRVKVEVYPGGQLCSTFRQCLEAVQVGAIEITGTTVGGAANIFPEMQVTDIPYIFPNDRVAEKVMQSSFVKELRTAVLEKTGTLRIMGLSNTGGWRAFYTTEKQIKTPADLVGVKVRTISSPLQVEMVKALGGSPTPIPWPELYTSFATGIAQGTKNGVTDIVNMKFQEFVKYGTLDNHAYLVLFWWMNDDFLKNLPNDIKKVVLDGFHNAITVASNDPKLTQLSAYAKFREAGGTIYVPTAAEKAMFVEKAREPLKEWYVKKYGDKWLKLLEQAIAQAEKDIAAEDAALLE